MYFFLVINKDFQKYLHFDVLESKITLDPLLTLLSNLVFWSHLVNELEHNAAKTKPSDHRLINRFQFPWLRVCLAVTAGIGFFKWPTPASFCTFFFKIR